MRNLILATAAISFLGLASFGIPIAHGEGGLGQANSPDSWNNVKGSRSYTITHYNKDGSRNRTERRSKKNGTYLLVRDATQHPSSSGGSWTGRNGAFNASDDRW